jgi:pyruvate dehydrogenase E2 component (dihydrolipoamide acetyltransferase)
VAELLTMPEVATGTTEAILSTWLVEPGKPFAAGDAILTIETEKAIVDVEADCDGVMLHLLAREGSTVAVGAPIAVRGVIGETVPDLPAVLASLGVAPSVAGADEPDASASVIAGPVASTQTTDLPAADVPAAGPVTIDEAPARLFTSPLARRLAAQAALDLSTVRGSGPRGRIRRVDVDAALRDRTATAVMPARDSSLASTLPGEESDAGSYRDVPNTRMRQAIARRLTESKQTAPHFYVRGSARVDRLLALRREANADGAVKVSVNDLLVKAVACTHVRVPGLNVQWTGEAIRHFDGVDVAVAVATEHGLVTPVVRGVDRLSVTEVAVRTRDLAERARDRRLQQHELEGATITVTNLGMYGTEEFAAIINPPQAAILAVGAARPEAAVGDGKVEVATVLHATLAVDHRPVDGATAADWMRVFVGLLERPAQILA